MRVPRRLHERIFAVLRRTSRYRCKAPTCAWEGILYGGANKVATAIAAWVVLLAAAFGAANCGTIIFERLTRQPRDGETIEAEPETPGG